MITHKPDDPAHPSNPRSLAGDAASVQLVAIHEAPEVTRFRCCQCGACCRNWRIELDAPSRILIEKALSLRPHPVWGITIPVDEPECPAPGSDLGPAISLIDGRCAFLTDKNSCWLHDQFGPETKPMACRTFPRKTTATSMGIFVSLKNSCHTAAESLTRDYSESNTVTYVQKERAFESLKSFLIEDDAVLLPAQYQELEDSFLEVLDRHDMELTQRLVAIATKVSAIDEAPAISWGDHVEVLGGIVGMLRTFSSSSEKFASLSSMLEESNLVFGWNEPDAEKRARLAYSFFWDSSKQVSDSILTNYMRRNLRSKFYTSGIPIRKGISILVILFALIKLCATVRAARSGRAINGAEIIRTIVDLDTNLFHLDNISDFWTRCLALPRFDTQYFAFALLKSE